METQCIATVLSSKYVNGLYLFNSILIVSDQYKVKVSCVISNQSSNVIDTSGSNLQNASLTKVTDNVLLQYMFQANIFGNLTTYFYICGVNDVTQAWQTTGLATGYSNTDRIGDNRTKLSGNLAIEAAFLLGFEPYSLVSVFILTTRSEINVKCASNSHQLTILYDDILNISISTTMFPVHEKISTLQTTIIESTGIELICMNLTYINNYILVKVL